MGLPRRTGAAAVAVGGGGGAGPERRGRGHRQPVHRLVLGRKPPARAGRGLAGVPLAGAADPPRRRPAASRGVDGAATAAARRQQPAGGRRAVAGGRAAAPGLRWQPGLERPADQHARGERRSAHGAAHLAAERQRRRRAAAALPALPQRQAGAAKQPGRADAHAVVAHRHGAGLCRPGQRAAAAKAVGARAEPVAAAGPAGVCRLPAAAHRPRRRHHRLRLRPHAGRPAPAAPDDDEHHRRRPAGGVAGTRRHRQGRQRAGGAKPDQGLPGHRARRGAANTDWR